MNLAQLRQAVYSAMAETTDNNDRLPTDRVDYALNEAYVRYARLTGCFRRDTTWATTTGGSPVTLPDDVVKTLAVDVAGTPLIKTTMDSLDKINVTWRNATNATPSHWYEYDDRTFGLYPPPTVGLTLRARLQTAPIATGVTGSVPTITAAADIPAMPQEAHWALVHGAIWVLMTEDLADVENAAARAQAAMMDFYQAAGIQPAGK